MINCHAEIKKIKTNTHQICLTGDSRTLNIYQALEEREKSLASIVKEKKFIRYPFIFAGRVPISRKSEKAEMFALNP